MTDVGLGLGLDPWLTWVAFGVVFVVALLVGLWLSHRMLGQSHRDSDASAGGTDAFGGLIDAFNPGHGRANRELESLKHQGEVLPSPDEGEKDEPLRLVERPGRAPQVRVRRSVRPSEPPRP